ncbi:molybdopterin-binding protein [Puniceibacterium sediminis]|uniref:Molybdenum cofactor cytidylyltransferase n=1 Tax=Puniceibacterium sediminis TaxID=1608407 RepID=A0A238V138_9RHOB|nr:molybdopterin-binding protein [Puniceibacterium sediminis]SNR28180.1 molybdenum cofactor cytidylyltransferase [Puniceibacterium sediminis]
MIFGAVPVADAGGAVLAHSVPLPGGRLRKGKVLGAADVAVLQEAGIAEVIVARLEPGDVAEDAAAERLAQALVPDAAAVGLRVGKASTGRVNIFADCLGVAEIEAAKIDAINAVHPMITVATVPEWQRMGLRGMVATVKIISYAVPEVALERSCVLGHDGMRMRAVTVARAQLIQTFVEADDGVKGQKAIGDRLDRLGVRLGDICLVPHETEALATAIRGSDAEAIFILTASATSDISDVGPAALRAAGGRVAHYGMPVDPGNLLFYGDLRGVPVIGLPGCARSPALNGADWVMERMLCGVPVTPRDIAGMGVGGLLKEIPTRPRPREG